MNVTVSTTGGIVLQTKGKYCEENIHVSIDSASRANLTAENIAMGATVLGVEGSMIPQLAYTLTFADPDGSTSLVLCVAKGVAVQNPTDDLWMDSDGNEVTFPLTPTGDMTLTSGYITYTLSDDGTYYTVTACSNAATGAISVCNTVGGLPVTEIADSAFYRCTGMTGITIPDSVTSVGNYAFRYCTGLTKVTISGAASIGDYAFANCTSLTSAGMIYATSIGNYAFYNCVSLTDIVAWSVTSIGFYAFAACSSLTSAWLTMSGTWYVSATESTSGGIEVDTSSTGTTATLLVSTWTEYFWYNA